MDCGHGVGYIFVTSLVIPKAEVMPVLAKISGLRNERKYCFSFKITPTLRAGLTAGLFCARWCRGGVMESLF